MESSSFLLVFPFRFSFIADLVLALRYDLVVRLIPTVYHFYFGIYHSI